MKPKSNWEKEPKYPGSSKRRPQFTAWAHAERDSSWESEYIYLIREDGISHPHEPILSPSTKATHCRTSKRLKRHTLSAK